MKRQYLLLLTALILIFNFLSAQVWQDETVVRKQEIIDWDSCVAAAPNGDLYTVWNAGLYGCQGYSVQKTNAQGVSIWGEDALLPGNASLKWFPKIAVTSDGGVCIVWREQSPENVTSVYVTKLSAQGQLIWNPQSICIYSGLSTDFLIEADNNGGVFVVYSKLVPGYDSDLSCQRISAMGELLMPIDGLALTHYTYSEGLDFIEFASDASLIFGFRAGDGSDMELKVQKLLPNQQFAWVNPLNVSYSNVVHGSAKLTPIDATHYLISWDEGIDSSFSSKMQKMSLDGNLLFPVDVSIATNASTTLAVNQAGDIFVTVHQGYNMPPMQNSLKKYGSDGNPLWGNGVNLPDSLAAMFVPVPDAEGGCYILKKHLANYDSQSYGFTFQHYDNEGTELWENGGIEIVNNVPYKHHYKMAMTFTDRFIFTWVEHFQNKEGVYRQTRDLTGQLLSPPRMTIHDGLSGGASMKGSIARNNDILVYWDDDRNSTAPQERQTYFQIVNPDGSVDLQPNGVLLVDDAIQRNMFHDYQVVYLTNGSTVFLWTKFEDSVLSLRGQSVGADGSVQWEPEGRIFMEMTASYQSTSLVVSAEDNDIYVALRRQINTSFESTYIQKISNGAASWGDTGIAISSELPDLGAYEYPVSFKNRFLVLEGRLTNPNREFLWVTHIEPDGSISPQWEPGSATQIINCEEILQDWFSSYTPVTAILDGNLFIAYNPMPDTYSGYNYCVFQPDATLLVTPQHLFNDTLQEMELTLDTTDGIAMCFKQYNWQPDTEQLCYNKLTSGIEFPWGNTPITAQELPQQVGYKNFNIAGFGEGGYAIYWYPDNSFNLHCGFINAVGVYQSPTGGEIIRSNTDGMPAVSGLGNELYFAWFDGTASYFPYDGAEIRMQKYANPTVGIPADTIPAQIVTMNCYPNPFNAQLNISLSVPDKGRTQIDIYNIKGQKVKSLTDTILDKGEHSFTWNGKDSRNASVATGVYYLRLTNNSTTTTRKIVVIK